MPDAIDLPTPPIGRLGGLYYFAPRRITRWFFALVVVLMLITQMGVCFSSVGAIIPYVILPTAAELAISRLLAWPILAAIRISADHFLDRHLSRAVRVVLCWIVTSSGAARVIGVGRRADVALSSVLFDLDRVSCYVSLAGRGLSNRAFTCDSN